MALGCKGSRVAASKSSSARIQHAAPRAQALNAALHMTRQNRSPLAWTSCNKAKALAHCARFSHALAAAFMAMPLVLIVARTKVGNKPRARSHRSLCSQEWMAAPNTTTSHSKPIHVKLPSRSSVQTQQPMVAQALTAALHETTLGRNRRAKIWPSKASAFVQRSVAESTVPQATAPMAELKAITSGWNQLRRSSSSSPWAPSQRPPREHAVVAELHVTTVC
mmetsp:Transcript_80558/g.224142  ORF Transcript_80558/g.224142 Transcript_80558/m.224142 type:complete len:222 (+) Transcript_80558:319-984(+)